MRTRTLWNNGWEFCFDASCGEELPKDAHWQPVTLPHDWQIWHVENLYLDGTGWYRKRFAYTPGMRCCLLFEGVYMDTAVFVNGCLAAEWKYGYSSFEADVTDWLHGGENEILVRCLVKHPNSRWYSGAGIYRDVWLLTYPDSHLLTDGLYIASRELENGTWKMEVSAETANCRPTDRVQYTLLADSGCEIASICAAVGETAELTAANPKLWDIDSPNCYRLLAELLRGDMLLDSISSVCGFRTLELDAQKGFFLNHRHVVLHGVCLHHDLGCLGAAFNLSAAGRQLEIMRDMGVNALRTAHNMPAPGVMELADRMGILVVNEAFDCWTKSKTPYDYAGFFPEWHSRDVASWVRRDRNHPSLLFWSIGNEIYDTHQDAGGRRTMQRLLEEVIRHDPKKNGLTTFGSNYMPWENTQKCADLPDAVGYNYGERLYDDHHQAHPDWMIYGSETASVVQSRGVYHFPLEVPLLVDDDLQCSSLGNSRTSWGAKSHQACLAADEEHPYSLGQFLWSGIDYIGEPTPYHTKNSYFGAVDTAGFRKDAFYVYQSGWHPWQEKPVLHLLPYWDFNPGQMIDVCILSNLPQVELTVNGVSLGRKNLKGGSDNQAAWKVPYAPGCIQATGYDAGGNVVMQQTEHSFGDAARLVLKTDRTRIDNSGRELLFCEISALDADGYPVRNANNAVTVETSGSVQLVGMDNGNSADPDEYKTNQRRLFSGKLLAVFAGSGEPGTGRITVHSEGLESAGLPIQVTAAEQHFPVLPEIPRKSRRQELLPRRIALSAQTAVLTPENKTTVITANILPECAQAALSWRVTDDRGITVNHVVLEPIDDHTVRATAAGDGHVRIRCMAGLLISELELEVRGIGSLSTNPYEFVSAAHYSDSHGEIGNGNERGIATSRTEMSWVAYDRLDFGAAGADTVMISVFEMAGIPTPIRFWKGIPYAPGSRMIGERIYDKPTNWNVYKEETFRLDELLTDRDIFGIELQCKVHIKGFAFRERTRGWDCISTAHYDSVYGDSFTLQPDSVNGIGNNVSLIFRNLDFGPQGLGGVKICGRSKLENNTIHLCFEHEGAQERRVVEFQGCTDWQERFFTLEPITGKQDVTFLFLPGCDFDFMSFRFVPRES